MFSPELEAMFREMNDEIKRTAGDDPPKRINGVFDDDSLGRFNRYLETYKAEHARLLPEHPRCVGITRAEVPP
jgi:hypothetical protein